VHSFSAKALVILGLSATLLLGACGEEEGGASPSATPAATTPAASASPSATPTPSPTPKPIKPSDDFNKVSVRGGFGEPPKVRVDSPWAIDKTRTDVLDPGKGAVVKAGQTVEVNYHGVNGRTGKMFDESFTTGQPVAFPLDQVVPGFGKGLVGQKQGSRVVIAMPGPDGYDSSGGNPQAGIEVGDTLIFVVDLVAVQLPGPQGVEVKPKDGLPTVTEKDGLPVISVPKTDPPTTLQVQPLIKGVGKKVRENDTITFDYNWARWSDGKVLEETYSTKPATSSLTALVPGMVKGLTGQTVGSRVLLVIPPAAGYPDGNPSPSVGPNETLVMVVDLLFTATQ